MTQHYKNCTKHFNNLYLTRYVIRNVQRNNKNLYHFSRPRYHFEELTKLFKNVERCSTVPKNSKTEIVIHSYKKRRNTNLQNYRGKPLHQSALLAYQKRNKDSEASNTQSMYFSYSTTIMLVVFVLCFVDLEQKHISTVSLSQLIRQKT